MATLVSVLGLVVFSTLLWGNAFAQMECHLYLDVTGNDLSYCGTTASPCKTLEQTLIQIRCSTTVIHIASGYYNGYGNKNLNYNFTGKKLLLLGSDSVVFDAENKMGILSLKIDDGLVQFEGITFTRGRTQQHGGCVSIISEHKGFYQFNNCQFVECSTNYEGGGLYAKVGSPSMFVNVSFLDCTAGYGSAAMFDGGSIAIKDCTFKQKTAVDALYSINASISEEGSLYHEYSVPTPQPYKPQPYTPQPYTPSLEPVPIPQPEPEEVPELPLPVVLGIVIGSVGFMLSLAIGMVCWRRYNEKRMSYTAINK